MMSIEKNVWSLLVFMVCGLMIGSVVNTLLTGRVPPSLTQSVFVGVDPPFELNLSFFQMEFGFLFQLNFLSLIGMVLSIVLFRKL